MEQGLDVTWRKSSYSGGNGGSCVEVGSAAGSVSVRDTKQAGKPGRVILSVPAEAWQRFTAALR